MKLIRSLLRLSVLALVIASLSVIGQGQNAKSSSASGASPQQTDLPTTIAAMVDREISDVEKQVVDAAKAIDCFMNFVEATQPLSFKR
jgi:hypothetical protein